MLLQNGLVKHSGINCGMVESSIIRSLLMLCGGLLFLVISVTVCTGYAIGGRVIFVHYDLNNEELFQM